MAARKPIGKKVRFEVFKRDSFTCQYCGAKSPDVVLHVDHINPVSKGGKNDILNLITACEGCNQGKSDRALDDDSALQKQRSQLDELNERREQLAMMLKWRDSMSDLNGQMVDEIATRIERQLPRREVNENGRRTIRGWLRKFKLEEILDAIDISVDRLKIDDSLDDETASRFFQLVPKVCSTKRLPESQQRMFYARGILRNRMYVNEAQVMRLMQDAVAAGLDVEDLIQFAKEVPNWTAFKREMEEIADGQG